MNPIEMIQSINAVGTIALIMIGSMWLKNYLKQYAG